MKRQCRCSPRQIEQYRQRISAPLLDRIDIHCEVPLVDFRELSQNSASGEKSELIRERVVEARRVQTERFRKLSNRTNSSGVYTMLAVLLPSNWQPAAAAKPPGR